MRCTFCGATDEESPLYPYIFRGEYRLTCYPCYKEKLRGERG